MASQSLADTKGKTKVQQIHSKFCLSDMKFHQLKNRTKNLPILFRTRALYVANGGSECINTTLNRLANIYVKVTCFSTLSGIQHHRLYSLSISEHKAVFPLLLALLYITNKSHKISQKIQSEWWKRFRNLVLHTSFSEYI